ncbi:MAG: hypothetical protein JNL28_01160 [Planctomycetes bacterium]|nr:hypothetical protein [Planctomycetota bacterium]
MLVTCIGLVLAMTYALGPPEAFYIVLGMLIGCLARDFGWLRNMRIAWSFNVRVVNWDKVQRIADGEQV